MKIHIKKLGKLKYILGAATVFALFFGAWFGYHAYAAADQITLVDSLGNTVSGTVIELREKRLQLNMQTTGTAYADSSLYEVRWTIENNPLTGDPIASVTPGSVQTTGLVTALSPGTITVTCTVYDKLNGLAQLASATCDVHVVFSIDRTQDDSKFKNIYEDDELRSLVLYSDSGAQQMYLNFGDATNTQWTVAGDDNEVATVGLNSGIITPVGAGHVKITATYTPEGSTSVSTDVLDVYVIPRVADSESDYEAGNFSKSITDSRHAKGEYLYIDTIFGGNNTVPVKDKVMWVIKKDNTSGDREVIANSLPASEGGKTSELISLNPLNSQSSTLQIQAKAGTYYIEFYTKGTYQSETKKTEAYQPTVVKLTVYANFHNRTEILRIGDSYAIATAFNLTLDDFKRLFSTPVLTYGGGDASLYATYDSANASVNAIAQGLVNAKITPKTGTSSEIISLTNPSSGITSTTFNIGLNIQQGFSIDRTSAVIKVGEDLQLNPVYYGVFEGNVTWSSSNTKYVKVSENGMITGVKSTNDLTENIVITATFTEDSENGHVWTAQCIVKVDPAVSAFSLTPTELLLEVGQTAVVTAEIKQTVSTAPFDWKIEDTSVIDFVSINNDKKGATVQAKSGGETIIVVTNTDNQEQHYVHVRVRVGIESMYFSNNNVTVRYDSTPENADNNKLSTKVVYLPTNANDTHLTIESLDPTVATCEDTGDYLGYRRVEISYFKPGQTVLVATPDYNPNKVVATCSVTVLSGATELAITPTEMTLNAAYGNHLAESQQIVPSLLPIGCQTDITYEVDYPDIVSVSETGLVTAKKLGKAIVTVKTTEGLTQKCSVTVNQPCSDLAFKPDSVTVVSGNKLDLNTMLQKTPKESNDTYTWTTRDKNIATVDSLGILTGVKSGTTYITVKANNSGIVAVLLVTVQDGVRGLEFDKKQQTIEKGRSFNITAIFTPATAFNKTLNWSVSDRSVVSVTPRSSDGNPYAVVTGLKGGVALVTAEAVDGGYRASCLVVVTEKATSVTVKPAKKYLKLGSSFTVAATVSSPNATNKKVKWSTSKKKVATVSQAGRVKGKKIGTAYIRATATDGSGAYAQCKVMVVRKVTSVRLNKYSAKLIVGKTLKLKAKVRPKNATIKSVTWSSSNNTIATVSSSGRVLGLAEGLVKIRAKANDGSGKSATCIIHVIEPVDATGVSVPNAELIVAKGRKIQSGMTISPANSTDKLKFFSDDKKIATIDKRGKIRAKRTGEATLYAKTSNGKLGYIDLLVVAMNRRYLKMRVYDTETIRVNEISTGVTWFSSNPLVASVQNGKIVGRRPGKTTVYATVRGLRLKCRVTITRLD